jgi:NTE family protein
MNTYASSRRPAGSRQVCLALSGGNALGAYAAGAFEQLDVSGYRPEVISGASIGALTGALIAGNPPERRVPVLREFWALASSGAGGYSWPWLQQGRAREWLNAAHALQTFMFGRPGLFGPRYSILLSLIPGAPQDVALFESKPVARTLERLVDFDYLHDHGPQLIVCAVDVETGEPVYFDSRRERITTRHLLASTGFLPGMPPMEVDGRLLGDPGLVCNLPLDPILRAGEGAKLCFAVDLFSGAGSRPKTLDASIERAQDITFSAQTARSLQASRREQRLRKLLRQARQMDLPGDSVDPEHGPEHVDVVLIAYRALAHEIGAKTLEFSGASLRERWNTGRRDMADGLARLDRKSPDVEDLGFALYRSSSEA